MATRQDFEYATQAPAGYVGDFLQQGIFPYARTFLDQQFQNLGTPDSSPFTYTGQRVADFDPREQYAMDLSDSAIGSYRPYLGAQSDLLREAGDVSRAGTRKGAQALGRSELSGLASTQMFNPNMSQQFYNPFEDQVVQQTLSDVGEGLAKSDIALRDNAVQAGAFGGSRGRLTQEDLARQVGRGAAEAVGGIRQQGFAGAQDMALKSFADQQARQAGLANLQAGLGSTFGQLGGNLGQGLAGYGQSFGNMAPSLQNLQTQDINRTMGIGGLGRGRNQSLMDLAYQNFTGQYNLPMQTLSNVGSLTASLGPLAGGYGFAGKNPPTSTPEYIPNQGGIPQYGGGAKPPVRMNQGPMNQGLGALR